MRDRTLNFTGYSNVYMDRIEMMETCAWLIAVWALNVYISSVTMSVCLRVQHGGGEVGGGGGGGPGGRAGRVQTGGQSPGPASLPAGGG